MGTESLIGLALFGGAGGCDNCVNIVVFSGGGGSGSGDCSVGVG